MQSITQKFDGKVLSANISIPVEWENQELEIIVQPVALEKRFSKLYENPIKIENFTMPTREERNAR